MLTPEHIINKFKQFNLDFEQSYYLMSQAKRLAYLLKTVKQLRREIPEPSVNILDIGPSFFTEIIKETLSTDTVITMGLEPFYYQGDDSSTEGEKPDTTFYRFDLNDTQYPEKWIKTPLCAIIIMGEVIEHLHTAPTLVLNFLRTLLSDGGYLIIQTPNAVVLHHRIRMLLGKNPFEMIRTTLDNPGHFREYTINEMTSIAQEAGFQIRNVECRNYYDYTGYGTTNKTPSATIEKRHLHSLNRLFLRVLGTLYGCVLNIAPPSWKPGIIVVLQKPR